jgi:hypothetical protein
MKLKPRRKLVSTRIAEMFSLEMIVYVASVELLQLDLVPATHVQSVEPPVDVVD